MTEFKSTQAERRTLAGSTATSTYFHQSQIALSLDAPGGRFREKETIVGSELVPQYPKLPSSSPWAGDLVGLEQPLGVSVDDLEPTGTAAEIEASLAQVAAPVVPIIHDRQSTEVHLLPSSDGERKVVAGSSNESVGPATTSAEARLAEILPRLAVPKAKRRKV